MKSSIVSYPDRGPYGKQNWRGNTSGYLIKDLLEHFHPKLFVDVCEGGGTSRDVAKELGVNYVGLDLHSGFDFTKQSVLSQLPHPADLVFSHPAYHQMIDYVEERKKHGLDFTFGDDLSRCASVEEFLEKIQVMLLNQREACKTGGIYTTLIGDMRKAGEYHSFQADFIKMMPKNELLSVVIKQQHNTMSSFQTYKGNTIFIHHEYLLIWKKQLGTLVRVLWDKATEYQRNIQGTWKNFVKLALMNTGGKATLDQLYSEIERVAGDKLKSNPNYKAKVRQILQQNFQSVERGVWAIQPAS